MAQFAHARGAAGPAGGLWGAQAGGGHEQPCAGSSSFQLAPRAGGAAGTHRGAHRARQASLGESGSRGGRRNRGDGWRGQRWGHGWRHTLLRAEALGPGAVLTPAEGNGFTHGSSDGALGPSQHTFFPQAAVIWVC